MLLEGQVALVIGAAGAIGRASCARLAGAGARVIAVDGDRTGLADLVATQRAGGAEVIAEFVESGDENGFAQCIARTEAAFGPISIAHHVCAPTPRPTSILHEDIASFDACVDSHVGGLFFSMRYILPGMSVHGRGALAVSCSVAALSGLEGAASRTACDHAALGLVRAAAMDVVAQGVTVNAICHPASGSDLPMVDALPDAIADALLFLTSPLARSITGSHFVIDGGQSVYLAQPHLAQAA